VRRAPWTIALLAAAAACSGDDAGSGDNGVSGDASEDCWPVETSTPGGTIELGTGVLAFEPLPDELQFIRGTQGGTFLVLNARMKDLDPGDPDVLRAPGNPKSTFSATLFDGTVVERECPATVGYKPSAEEGYFERSRHQVLEFLPFELGQKAFDTDLTLKVEVIDSQGRYASDEKVVHCRAPVGWADAGPPEGDGGIPDGGVGDGGLSDASTADGGPE
jgi:hypothetical protein